MSNQEIKIITVNEIKELPARYIPFDGTASQARDAILKDRERKPENQKYRSGIDTIYEFISLVKTGWHITAIVPTPRQKKKIESIRVDEQVSA